MSLFIASCENYVKGWEEQSDKFKEEEATRCRELHPRGINLMLIATTDLTDGTFTPTQEFKERVPIYVTFEELVSEFLSGACPVSLLDKINNLVTGYDPHKAVVWMFMLVDTKKGGEAAEVALYTSPVNEQYRAS